MSDLYGTPAASDPAARSTGDEPIVDPAAAGQDQLIDSTTAAVPGARSMWNFSEGMGGSAAEVIGFDVECTDGHIGKVDAASAEVDSAHLVVDTGWWIFGKKRVVPAGTVTSIDEQLGTVRLRLTKDQVKDAPDWHEAFDPLLDEKIDPFDDYYNRIA